MEIEWIFGGHRFFSKSQIINDLWQEIMPVQSKPSKDDIILNREKSFSKEGPDPEKDDVVMLIRNRVSRIYYLKKFFDYPVSLKLQTIKNMGAIRTIKSGFSYLKACLIKKEESSLENFYINRFGKTLYSMFFEKYTEKLWGRHPSVISADWGAQRVKGISIKAVLKDAFSKIGNNKSKNDTSKVETSLIEEYKYPKLGPGQFYEELAKRCESLGAKIIYNANVSKLIFDNDKISKVEYIKDNSNNNVEADIVISSMPIKDLINCLSNVNSKDQNPTQQILDIANGLPYRDFMTCGLLLKDLQIKNETKIKTINNNIPDCWIYVQEPDVKMGRIQVFNNWSPYMVEDFEKTIGIGLEYFCQENDEYWNMKDEEFKDFAVSELEKMKIASKDDVLDFHVERIKKAYPAYFDTYSQMSQLIEYLNLFKNLYCVGRNGQHRYNNMDHSMLTAIEAVRCIKDSSIDKSIIWNVNTEKEYHEEK